METKENTRVLAKQFLDFHLKFGCWNAQNTRNHFNLNGKNANELSMRQFQILLLLYETKLETVSGLEEVLKISKSSLSLTISKMEKLGFITKSQYPDDADRRTVHIKVTPKGVEILKKFYEIVYETFDGFYMSLDTAQKENLKTGIEKLSKVFN